MADLFDIVVARKLSDGGGGSSDFSTATVTFVNNTAGNSLMGAAALLSDEEIICVYGQDGLDNSGSYTFVLYKGLNVMGCNNSDQLTITTSGNVNYDTEAGFFTITGDGTITIS